MQHQPRDAVDQDLLRYCQSVREKGPLGFGIRSRDFLSRPRRQAPGPFETAPGAWGSSGWRETHCTTAVLLHRDRAS